MGSLMCISVGVTMEVSLLSLDCFAQRGHADDIQGAREIVGEDAQRHLGGDLGKRLHQEVSCAHA
jgi:hypothetical protein